MSKAFQFPLKYVFQYIEKGKEESDLPGHSASEFSGHVTKSNNNISFSTKTGHGHLLGLAYE